MSVNGKDKADIFDEYFDVKPIIIDGCNVAECNKYDGNSYIECLNDQTTNRKCKDNPDCYFKQLQRLKAENEELKTKIFDEGLRRKTCKYYKQVCFENTQLIAYRNALEEIKAIAELEVVIFDNKPLFPTNIQRIIDKINEVLKDE